MRHVKTEIPGRVVLNACFEQTIERRRKLTKFPLHPRKAEAMFEHTTYKRHVMRAFAKGQKRPDFPCHRALLKSTFPASISRWNSPPVNSRAEIRPSEGTRAWKEKSSTRGTFVTKASMHSLLWLVRKT